MHPLCAWFQKISVPPLPDAVIEKHSISHATLHFICVCPRTFFQQFLCDLSAKGIRLSVVEFDRKYMKLTKFVCDLSAVRTSNSLIRYTIQQNCITVYELACTSSYRKNVASALRVTENI